LVGANGANQVFVYHGGPTMDAVADLTLSGSGGFGSAVSTGDVNGDGYHDVLVGANGANQVFIYHGGPTMDAVADLTLSGSGGFGRFIELAGDINADGYKDVIVGTNNVSEARIFYGGPAMDTVADIILTLTGNFGANVSHLEDINNDGYPDVIIGTYLNNQAFVYHGSGNRWRSVIAQNLNLSRGFTIQGTGVVFDPYSLTTRNAFTISTPNWEIDRVGNASFQDLWVGSSTRIGEATGSAGFRLSVSDHKAATVAAMIENLAAGSDADGLAIKLGYLGAGSSGNSFLTFLNGRGQIHGRIRSNAAGGVVYQTSGIDFAEYFEKEHPDDNLPTGTLVCQGEKGVRACRRDTDQGRYLGIISAHPAFLGGVETDTSVIVGLVGQVPVKVDPSSPPIASGDLLTFAPLDGYAMKATSSGFMVGRALEDWEETKETVMVFISNLWANLDTNESLSFSQASAETLLAALSSLEEQVETLELSLSSVANRLTFLEETIASLSATLTNENNASSPSASLAALDARVSSLENLFVNLLEQWEASPSSLASFLSALPSLTVIGNTSLANTTIAGQLLVDGELALSRHGISALSGTLKLNNGAIAVDQHGNATFSGIVKGIKIETSAIVFSSNDSIGSAEIPPFETSVDILTPHASTTSAIFVTATLPTDLPLAVLEKTSGKFRVGIPSATSSAIPFDWMIIQRQ
ncbi:MAG: FG-GAP-like repeat-containing protein, partial [Candidatus Methanomethylicaceae archaeon]